MADANRAEEADIEITPEMIKAARAGYAEVAGWDPTPEELDAGLVASFRAMLSARRKLDCGSPQP